MSVFLRLENQIPLDLAEAKANPHRFSTNIAGDLNFPPPGSDERKLDTPSAEGPADALPRELHQHRPFYHRWANIFAQLKEIVTDSHTHITTGTLSTDTLDRVFTTLPRSSGNHLEQTVTVLSSPTHYLAKQISDHSPLIWTIFSRNPAPNGTFTARPEWIKHPRFSESVTMMADSADFSASTLEQQKECICIITEASAKAARDSIAFSDPGDIELRLMRLNSIYQAALANDAKSATSLIRYPLFSVSLLETIDGRLMLRDPAAFEEVFAEATRAHIRRENHIFLIIFQQT